jgi:hypothetical protein
MVMAMVLTLVWSIIQSSDEDDPVNNARVALMLPVTQEARARKRWRMRVGTPVALTVLVAILYHVGPALYGSTQATLPRTALLVLWMGTLAGFISVTDSLGAEWLLRSLSRFSGLLALSIVFISHPLAIEFIAHRYPKWAESVHLRIWELALMICTCVLLLCLSFLIRLRYRPQVLSEYMVFAPDKPQKPLFLRKRRGLKWWSTMPLMFSAIQPFVAAAVFALLPLIGPDAKADNGPFIFAILFITQSVNSDWRQDWPSFAKTLVLLHVGKRRILLSSLLSTGVSACLPLLLVLGGWWIEHLYLGLFSSSVLIAFSACTPFLTGFVFLAKAYVVCGGETYETRRLYLVEFGGLLVLTAVVLGFLVQTDMMYLSVAQIFLAFGLVTLPFGVWVQYDVVRRVLNDNSYYHGNLIS